MNKIPSVTRSLLIGCGLIIASTGAHAKVYRCVVNGHTTYSDLPCEGANSETVNMVAPASNAPAPVEPKRERKPDSVAVTANASANTAAPTVAAPTVKPAASGQGWHLAGEYNDRVRSSSKTLKRASYGIECDVSKRRPFVYAINNRYSLTAPNHSVPNQLQGPFYDSLDAAAAAACAAK